MAGASSTLSLHTKNLAFHVAICSVAAFGAGCCWCLDFSLTIHTTSKPMFQTFKTKRRLFSVVGWVWQHQKFIKLQEQANLSLLRGKKACKTSDVRWERWKLQSWPLGGFLPKSIYFEFFLRPKQELFETKKRVAPASAEFRRIRQPTAPPKCKTDQILPDCVKRTFLIFFCPKCLSFCRFPKIWRQKWTRGVFRTDGKRGCLRNSQRKSVKCGNGLRWETAGVALALLWQQRGWPSALQNMGVVEIASRRMHNCPAAIQSKMQELCKTEPAKHISCWVMITENMFLNLISCKFVWGHSWDMRQEKEVSLHPQLKRTTSGHRENQQFQVSLLDAQRNRWELRNEPQTTSPRIVQCLGGSNGALVPLKPKLLQNWFVLSPESGSAMEIDWNSRENLYL